jgi:hypothetical protein
MLPVGKSIRANWWLTIRNSTDVSGLIIPAVKKSSVASAELTATPQLQFRLEGCTATGKDRIPQESQFLSIQEFPCTPRFWTAMMLYSGGQLRKN